MKTGEDFRREFPEMEEGFQVAAHQVLQILHEGRVERHMRLRPAILVAALLVLLMGVSVAATWERWSLDDFIPENRITVTDEEWRSMVDAFEPVTVQTSVAEITVREALFDGYALYIVIDARPKGESVFFVPEGSEMAAPAREAACSLPDDITLREYIALNGYSRTYEVYLGTDMGGMTFMPEMELNEDGTATFYLRQRLQKPRIQAEPVDVTLYVSMCSDAVRYPCNAEMLLSIDQLPVLEETVSAEGVRHEFANSGVALSNLQLIRTPLSTYVTADAEIIDEAAYQARIGSYVIKFADTNGAECDAGPFNLRGFMCDPVDRNHTGPLYYTATLTMQKLPDAIAVMEYPWGKYEPELATDIWCVPMNQVN